MTLIDILVSCALMILVLRQIRGRKLTIFSLIWPILLVGWAVIEYMTGFPLHNNGWMLIIGCITIGLILGVACGMTTAVYTPVSYTHLSSAITTTVAEDSSEPAL